LARLGLICLDCEDPAGLAAFWAGLLGGEATPLSDDVVMVKNDGTALAAVRTPGYQPPTWPGPAIPKQVHLDLAVRDLDAAEAEAVRLGARRAGEQPRPARWRVMLDPAGHPFCLCDWSQALPWLAAGNWRPGMGRRPVIPSIRSLGQPGPRSVPGVSALSSSLSQVSGPGRGGGGARRPGPRGWGQVPGSGSETGAGTHANVRPAGSQQRFAAAAIAGELGQ